MNDRAPFYNSIRASLFGGKLSGDQVAGMDAILDHWGLFRAEHGTFAPWLAYMLATVYHETAQTMRPIAEYGKGKGRPYGQPGRNKGQRAYGRGFVQLTWDDNYEHADRELGLGGRLIANYDLALDLGIACLILIEGMHEGWFAGDKRGRHTLARYLKPGSEDYVGARRIINGTDRAALIAGYASRFEAAIRGCPALTAPLPVAPIAPTPVQPAPARPVAPVEPTPFPPKVDVGFEPAKPAGVTWLRALLDFVILLFTRKTGK